jgi:hypothetical protein
MGAIQICVSFTCARPDNLLVPATPTVPRGPFKGSRSRAHRSTSDRGVPKGFKGRMVDLSVKQLSQASVV